MPVYRLGDEVAYSRHAAVASNVQTIGTQLKLYKNMNGFYPTSEQGLRALVAQPDTDPKPSRWYQFLNETPKDPWHGDYTYRCPGMKNPQGYDLFSPGPDRIPDTVDDDWGG